HPHRQRHRQLPGSAEADPGGPPSRLTTSAPDFPAAVNEPGVQSGSFIACSGNRACANFAIDGRDYSCTTCTSDAAWYTSANWSASSAAPQKLGIATQPGVQANKSPTTYEQNVESAFTSGTSGQVTEKQGKVAGRDQGTGVLATGLTAIASST